MDFSSSEDHDAIREGIRRVCAQFPDEYWREKDEQHEFPWDFYQAMAEGGWIGIAIPEEFGGGGQGITEASIVLEEVAASGAAMNGCSAIHLSMFGMEPVRKYGSPDLANEILPKVANGSLHAAFGVTEPDAGTDTTSIRTRAERDGDEYVITGAKVWTTKAPYCDVCLLLVRTTPKELCDGPTQGMTLLLVDLDDPTVDTRPAFQEHAAAVLKQRTRFATAEMFFEGPAQRHARNMIMALQALAGFCPRSEFPDVALHLNISHGNEIQHAFDQTVLALRVAAQQFASVELRLHSNFQGATHTAKLKQGFVSAGIGEDSINIGSNAATGNDWVSGFTLSYEYVIAHVHGGCLH